MNTRLAQLFQQLEEQRAQLIGSLQHVAPEKLKDAPPGKWSVNQILAHMITAERLSLVYLKKKGQGIEEAGDTGWWEDLKLVALRVSQRLPLKFKAPRVVVEHTPTEADIRQLLADWDNLRLQLKAFLETIPDRHIRKKIYKHVFAGRLNVQHAMLFFREHIIHHLPQIQNRLK